MALNQKQLETAAIITRIGHDVGATQEQITAALAGSWVESRLGTLDGGDNGTAWGIFQQRPISGWGNKSEVSNPYYAAKAFFTGVNRNVGLLDVWSENRSAGLNVQAVQHSAFPRRYDAAMSFARNVLGQLKSIVSGSPQEQLPPVVRIDPQPQTPGPTTPPKPKTSNTQVQRILVLTIGLVLILLALGNLSSGR